MSITGMIEEFNELNQSQEEHIEARTELYGDKLNWTRDNGVDFPVNDTVSSKLDTLDTVIENLENSLNNIQESLSEALSDIEEAIFASDSAFVKMALRVAVKQLSDHFDKNPY